jgi:hypothetical protein
MNRFPPRLHCGGDVFTNALSVDEPLR